MHQPGDLRETFACAQQAQYFDLARCQFRKTVFGKSWTGKCDALRDRRRQEYPTLAYLANGFDEIAGVAGFGHVAFGACLDGARCKYRIVIHAEHDDARRSVTRHNSPGEFKTGNPRQIDVDDANVGSVGDKSLLAAFGVWRLQDRDIRGARQQRPTPRGHDRMIVNDQDTHRHRSEGLRQSVCSATWRAPATAFDAVP